MKGILMGLLALGTISAYGARTLEIENVTYPEQRIILSCLDESCESINTLFIHSNEQAGLEISRSVVERTIDNRRKITGGAPEAYKLTKKAAASTKRRYKEAYYGKAALNALGTAGASIIDTVILPGVAVGKLLSDIKLDSAKDKKAAKILKRNLDSDLSRIALKHKYFEMVSSYIKKIRNYNSEYGIIERFAQGEFTNCYVKLKVSGWANQLYINGEFGGNFDVDSNKETMELVKRLYTLVENGTCR